MEKALVKTVVHISSIICDSFFLVLYEKPPTKRLKNAVIEKKMHIKFGRSVEVFFIHVVLLPPFQFDYIVILFQIYFPYTFSIRISFRMICWYLTNWVRPIIILLFFSLFVSDTVLLSFSLSGFHCIWIESTKEWKSLILKGQAGFNIV